MLTYIKKYIAIFIILILANLGIATAQESQSDVDVLKQLQTALTTGPIHQAIKGMTDSAGINVYPMFHIADDSALWPYAAELYFDVRAERKEPYLIVTLNFIPETGKWTDFASYKVQVHITQGKTKAIPLEVILPVEKQLNDLLANIGNLKQYVGEIRDNVADAIRKLRMAMMDKYWVGKNLPLVAFSPAPGSEYGFDPPVQEAIVRKYPDFYRYDTVVLAPWKSLSLSQTDKVSAYITVRDTAFKKNHIRFVNNSGVVLPPIQTKQDTLTFSLTGIAEGKEDELTAEYYENDPAGKERKAPLGQVKTITYTESMNTVHLVLVNGAKYSGNIEDLKKYLKNAYKQAVVSWDVIMEDIGLTVKDWDLDGDGKLKIETSILQRYSDEENTFINAWETANPKSDTKAAYLFIVDMPNSLNARGYMPLNANYGFIFVGGNNSSVHDKVYQNTIAHELGHGIFKLYHPWDVYGTPERQTNNLMDYQMGATLWKPQWDWIHDPGIRTYMFQDEEEGAMINRVAAILDAIKSNSTKTPGSMIAIPWYGGSSNMTGSIKIGEEEIDCEISLKNKNSISNNKIMFTVPDFKSYYTSPGSTIKTYYSSNSTTIYFNELSVLVNVNYLRKDDYTYRETQTGKVLNYIKSGFSSNEILEKIKKCNAKFETAYTPSYKDQLIEELLSYDIDPKYYTELSVKARVASIQHIMAHKHVFQNVTDTEEQEILYLIDNINDTDISKFLSLLETEKFGDQSVAITLLKNFQDATLSTVTGTRDYYTSLLQIIIRLSLKDNTRIAKLVNYEPEKTIKLGYIPWWKIKNLHDFNYTTEFSKTQVIIQESCYLPKGTYNINVNMYGTTNSPTPAYGWVKSKAPINSNPFDLVILDDRSDLSFDFIQRIYNGEKLLNGIRAIPAAAIDYVNQKKTNKTYADITYLSIDVLSMAIGVGELATAYEVLSNSRKIIVALDILNSGTNFVVNSTELQSDETIKKWLDIYNAATLFSNFAQAYKGGNTIIKISKVGDEILDAVYNTQKSIINRYKGSIARANNNAKGVFGEISTDVKFTENGCEALHIRKGQNGDLMDGWGGSGIDHIYKKGNKYYIVESKFGTNELAKTTIDGPQMSNPWIEGSNRIFNVVGVRAKELEIINSGYTRVLSKISDDGSVVLKKLDNMGNEIGDFTF